MYLGFFSLLVLISIADFSEHKIPNIYLKYLLLSAIPFISLQNLQRGAIAFLLLLFFWKFASLGMGDVKLLSIIFIALNFEATRGVLFFLTLMAISLAIYLFLLLLAKGTISGKIPLAPAITVACAIYLSTPRAHFLPQYLHALANSW